MSKSKVSLIRLIVEKSNGEFWGRVNVHDNLIVDNASSFQSLRKKMTKLIKHFEGVEVSEFEVVYDLTSFFEQYSFLNISDIAQRSGINASLMRQYASGVKFPSEERIKIIEAAIHEIGKDLARVKLHKPNKEAA